MKTPPTFLVFAALIGLSAFGAAPAGANSALSGYGGPGQGSQDLLGSTLIKAHRGNGNGNVRSLGASTQTEERQAGAVPAGSGTKGGPTNGEAAAPARGTRTKASAGKSRSSAAPASEAQPLYPSAHSEATSGAAGTSTLGLSGSDLAIVLIAAAVLFATALATTAVARDGTSKARG